MVMGFWIPATFSDIYRSPAFFYRARVVWMIWIGLLSGISLCTHNLPWKCGLGEPSPDITPNAAQGHVTIIMSAVVNLVMLVCMLCWVDNAHVFQTSNVVAASLSEQAALVVTTLVFVVLMLVVLIYKSDVLFAHSSKVKKATDDNAILQRNIDVANLISIIANFTFLISWAYVLAIKVKENVSTKRAGLDLLMHTIPNLGLLVIIGIIGKMQQRNAIKN